MATYRLTSGDDTRSGTNVGDTFDGYESDDGFGATGGVDTLDGRAGDDTFLLNVSTNVVSGLIDGGADTDTVASYGSDLGQLSFQNVEVLSVEAFEFGATIAQLNAFSTITTSIAAMPRISFYLAGDGGAIDFSTRMAPDKAVRVIGQGLNSGYDVTGTGLDDSFVNSRYDDTVHAGGGADIIFAVNRQFAGSSSPEAGGTDTVFGEAGADSFYLRAQSGTFDGGGGVDTVYALQVNEPFVSPLGDLGDATFLNMERLVTGARITYATLGQLASFSTITGGDANKQIWFDQRSGAGGTIDFSTKLKLAGEHVVYRAFGATSAVNVTGTAGNDSLWGSDFDDSLTGGAGNDILVGSDLSDPMSGRDTLRGGSGDDAYYIDGVDIAIETETGDAGGIDTVFSAVSCDLANTPRLQGEFENLTLVGFLGAENPNTNGYGNVLDNVITGNDGNNYIDGRAGADTMTGKNGNDIYVVDDVGDAVVERVGFNAGTDRVLSSVSFDLTDTARVTGFIETVVLQGSAAIDATGDDRANTLIGNAGANILDGGGGGDLMRGGEGDDTYYVDDAGDRAFEADVAGIDTVYASVSYSFGNQSLENLVLTGSAAINGTGNYGVNTIIGNDAANTLNGAGGNDILSGLGGDDRYYVDTLSDAVIEASGGGTDVVLASASYTLMANQEIEVLRANAGNTGLVLTGNEKTNTIVGGGGDDRLAGGLGADSLAGGGGSDVFVFKTLADSGLGAARDVVSDFAEGTDRIDLSLIDANTTAGATGNQDFIFIDGAFTGQAGQLHQVTMNGNTFVEGDVDGNGTADFQIQLRGLHTLQGTDFVL